MVLKAGLRPMFLILIITSHLAIAADQYSCRGVIAGSEGRIRGQMTIASTSISIDRNFLWIRDNASYSLKGINAIRLRRGLLFTHLRMTTNDDSYITVRTWSWNYEPIRVLIKNKL